MIKNLHDTHFHLDLFNNKLKQIADNIERNKIYVIAVTNLPPLYSVLANKLGESYRYIRPALGFHPELIGQYQEFIPEMWKLLPKTKFIGEVGLDFKIANEFKDLQINFFENLIEKCNQYGDKILTIHSRRSAEVILSIIGSKFKGKYILHWYSGNKRTLRRALTNGAYISINYAMTTSVSGRNIINEVPLDRLLLESDGPFINFRSEVFTPMHNRYIIKNLSCQKNLSEEEMSAILFKNFKSLINK